MNYRYRKVNASPPRRLFEPKIHDICQMTFSKPTVCRRNKIVINNSFVMQRVYSHDIYQALTERKKVSQSYERSNFSDMEVERETSRFPRFKMRKEFPKEFSTNKLYKKYFI